MQIVHFVDTTDLRDGGVPRFVLDAARVMAEAGHPSTILTTDTTDSPHAWIGNRMGHASTTALHATMPLVQHVARSKVGKNVLSAETMRDVRASIKNADVVHLHCVWSIANLQIAAACRAMGVPYIVSSHGMLDDWSMAQGELKKKLYMRLGGRVMLERAARVHCTAQAEVDQSKKWFANGREYTLPYLMDLSDFRELPGTALAQSEFACVREAKANGTPVVLFLSRLHEKKGLELLIESAAQMRDDGKNVCVVIAGTGEARYVSGLKRLASKLHVDDCVHFVGMVKGSTKVSLYQCADLFVLPTRQENFGLVLTEAMACGTPVVTTQGTDIWKDIARSGGGVIVQHTASAIAEEVTKLLENPAKLAMMASKARPWVFANFDETVLTPKFVQMYQTAMGQNTQMEAKPVHIPAMQRLQPAAVTG